MPATQTVIPRFRFAAAMLFLCATITACAPVPSPAPIRVNTQTRPSASVGTAAPSRAPATGITPHTIDILVDDFVPQPIQGESVYFFNRLEGDRGALNNSILDWGKGEVTAAVSPGNSWGGFWMSLNHPIREGQPISFSAILPEPILPFYQSRITGITVHIIRGTPGIIFRLELKDGVEFRWKKEFVLTGGEQDVRFDLPTLESINQLVFVLDQALPGDYVTVTRVSYSAETRITDTALAAFVWSYGMLLSNWNPATGLVRDKAKDAAGEFDAIQATGSLAAATALAEQAGIIERAEAIQIVQAIGDALLTDLPRYQGLWPHWARTSSTGERSIVENTEWSSVDTVIAAVGLLEAQTSLGLDSSETERVLREINWEKLVTPIGISHGFNYSGDLIPYAWDVFGGESWLVELAYSAVKGKTAPLAHPSPPTANGSGFIDELAWLFFPPPAGLDYWGTDWSSYRAAAADAQIAYYPKESSLSCFSQYGFFGLSAGEVPAPWMVDPTGLYQAYGVGGSFTPANQGSAWGMSVVTPHYSAMIASLRPKEAVKMWDWLIAGGFFTPLTNVESLGFTSDAACEPESLMWNSLKGSWNLALQTLGWGRYLAERDGSTSVLWQAVDANPLLRQGYLILTARGGLPTPASASQTGGDAESTGIWASNRLPGKSVNALAMDPAHPATLYAGTDDGLFISSDGGENWIAAGLPGIKCRSLAIDPVAPATVFTGTDNGVYKSTDGGGNWSPASLSGIPVYSLVIDPITAATIFAGTGSGAFKSVNSGVDWSRLDGGLVLGPSAYAIPVNALAIHPEQTKTLFAGTISSAYPGTWRYIQGHVYKSVDGGGNWREAYSTNNSIIALAIDPKSPDTLYAGTDGGIIKSTNGGENWIEINHGLSCPTAYAFAIDPRFPATVYVGTGCGIFITTDGGDNWSSLAVALAKHDILSISIDSTSATIYLGTKNFGLFIIR